MQNAHKSAAKFIPQNAQQPQQINKNQECRAMFDNSFILFLQVLIDTNHFKGNYPDSCRIEGKPTISMESEGILIKEKSMKY